MPKVFCESNVRDAGMECKQIIQIVDNSTNICYELLKQDNTDAIIVHYTNNQYIIKEYVNYHITLADAIRSLGLSVSHFCLYEEYSEHSLENMLSTKVVELPILAGHTTSLTAE